jgi:predicted AlkP superfamily phosphohydrolase/phosphomutase
MLKAFEEVDQAIGEIIAAAPEDAQIVVFAVHGMGNNVTDMYSMTFLPEVLYRFNFPGQFGLAHGKLGTPPPSPLLHPKRKSWSGEIWQRRYDPNPIKRLLQRYLPSKFDHLLSADQRSGLVSPYQLRSQKAPLHWMPAMWYQPLWPKMRAFALPAFAAGHIRINLQGREAEGLVSVLDYDALCQDITEQLYRLTDSRTGQPIVREIVRTRTATNALDTDPSLPDADLVVLWHDHPTDVVEHPQLGRIGPLTYYRSGGHRSNGFVLIKGSGIQPGSDLLPGQAIDLAPTILEMMGAPIPDDCDGKSLLPLPSLQLM